MKKIFVQDNVIREVDRYIRQYKTYYRDLYIDTGIFGLDTILESYEREANKRREEIVQKIITRLSTEIVHGRKYNNSLLLSWRSKTLFIAWEDEGEKRIITELIIR